MKIKLKKHPINLDVHHKNNPTSMRKKLLKEDEKEISIKYKLVGIMIKVMLVEGGVETQCIRSIPVETAPPEILAQVENLSFLDMIMIHELKNKESMTTGKETSKEIAEYQKHFDYI